MRKAGYRFKALLFLMLFAVGTMVSASSGWAQVGGTTVRLSTATATSSQSGPTISGTNVVWTDITQFTGGGSQADIYYYDLRTNGPARNLTNTPNDQEFLQEIAGNWIAWTHQAAGSPGDIVLYDLFRENLTNVATSSTAVSFQQPALSSQYVTFVRVTGQTDIDAFDYINGLPLHHSVTLDTAVQARPRVDGDFIVYEDYGSGNPNIFAYQLSTEGPIFPLSTSNSVGQVYPDISGNTVVWVEGPWEVTDPQFGGHIKPGTSQIVAYDLISQSRTQLSTVASNKIRPRISGSRVIWTDDRNGNLDIYLYDFSLQKEFALIASPSHEYLADIDGERVVYTSNERGAEEVYLFTFVTQATVRQRIGDLSATIGALNSGAFKNANMQNTLTNKINAVLQDIDQAMYQQALDKLQNDILSKTNGCAETGVADANDWIKDCATQAQIYPLIIELINQVKVLI
jgi:TolB protein